MLKFRRIEWIALCVLISAIGYWLVSEYIYFQQIRPNSIETIEDYFAQFNAPATIIEVETAHETHFVFRRERPKNSGRE